MKRYKIFDAHCDTLCMVADHGGDLRKNTYNLDITRMKEYEEYTQVFACFIPPEHRERAMARFNELADIYDAQDFSGIGHYLSVEGGEMINSFEDADHLKSRGVRCIALTWNDSNKIAGGADDPDQGLTPFGRDVVRRLNSLGILIDVSHLNDKSFYDIEKINTEPLIATHSNSRVICPHRRNLTDDMFKIIRDSGGAAGLNLYPPFVSESGICSPEDCIRHIDHWLELGGENAIGLGCDFDGVENDLPCGINGCGELYRLLGLLDVDIADAVTHRNFERVFGIQQ